MNKTILITGASTGIGKALAQRCLSEGWSVAATMRQPERSGWEAPNLLCTRLDVTDADSVAGATAEVQARFGRIDVLVNNAGYALMGPLEGTSPERMRRQIDTNLLGVAAMSAAVLPQMRQQGAGIIVNLSSIAGRLSFPMMSLYNATKFAVEGFSESLRYEVEPFGIRVKLIEPGPVRTDFYTRSLDWAEHPAYAAMSARLKPQFGAENSRLAATPERVVDTILRAATDTGRRLRYPVHHQPMWLARSLLGASGWGRAMRRLAAS